MSRKILDSFRDKKVVVTGGTGLIGRQVVARLNEGGARIRIVSLDRIQVGSNVEHIYGDLTDFGFCLNVTKGVDYVFHLAGIKGSIEVTKAKPASFFVPLLMMNTNMLEACRVSSVEKVVYTSSIGAYANAEVLRESEGMEDKPPMDMHPGWAKRMAELQVSAYKAQYDLDNFAIVRLCNVYGPGDNFDPGNAMVIPSLMYRIYHKEDPLVIWGDGSAVRDFAYSEDVAEGIILALHHGTKSRYINIGGGKGYSIRELVETLHGFIDFRYEFDRTKSSGFARRVMDITLAREMLGYNPTTSLREGLEKTWNWYVKNPYEYKEKQNYFRQ